MKTFKPIERLYCGWQPKKYYRNINNYPEVIINVRPTYGFVIDNIRDIHNFKKGDVTKILEWHKNTNGEKFINVQSIFSEMQQFVCKDDLLLC